MLAIISLILTLVIGVNFYFKWKHSYWSRRGVAQVEPKFLFGNFREVLFGKSLRNDVIAKAYYEFKNAGAKHGGIYFTYTPIWIPVDPLLIKQILHKDFWSFSGRGNFYRHKDDVLTNHLGFADDIEWKTMRAKVSPIFSSGKLKLMFDIINKVGDALENKVTDMCNSNVSLDIKEMAERYSTDIIVNCAFGIECNSLENPINDFRKNGRKVFQPRFVSNLLEQIFNWDLLHFLGYYGMGKDVDGFFRTLISDIINYRDKHSIVRHDFLNFLLQLRNRENVADCDEKNVLTFEDIVANSFVLFIGGFETGTSVMSFLMYELARHPEIQEKARREIWDACKQNPDHKITYDTLQSLKYCDMIINETLRNHTVATEVARKCTTDYQVPGTNVVIQKGTFVLIPIWAIHKDADYFPNPNEFNPDNFSDENKNMKKDDLFFPFGQGIRSCIGSRFAMIQLKLAMLKYLKNFKYELNPKTPTDIHYEANTFTIGPEGRILLDISKINPQNYI